jgi:hypothetical protein
MFYDDFLKRVIDDGIEAAKADYDKPEEKERLEGSIEGFEACRGKDPAALFRLLQQARRRTAEAHNGRSDFYWRIRCFEAEIEWICNVISASMTNSGFPPIVPVTANGIAQAARILADGAVIITEEAPL